MILSLPVLISLSVREFLLALPVLLFSMVAHEYAHGYAALKQGDDTALMLGRLTFNPLKHIDPWMTIILPVMLWFTAGFMFGGAKPVPVNPRKYRHYRSGDIIVSSAGIVVNLFLAIAFTAVTIGIGLVGAQVGAGPPEGPLVLLQRMALFGIWLNLLLAFFNLIPIPPLDGSHIFYHLLPPGLGARYRAFAPFGFVVLMVLVMLVPGFLRFFLFPAMWLRSLAFGLVAPFSIQPPAGS